MKKIIGISIGAFLGTILRFFLSQLNSGPFPISTFLINISGSFTICFFVELTVESIKISDTVKHLITTGFISSFTTFSTFVLEIIKFIINGKITFAIIYPTLSIIFGLLSSILGYKLARFILENKIERSYETE